MSAPFSMDWLRGIPRPVILFAGITLVFLAALAWLSSRVIAQDHAVEQQRLLERCELAAGNAAAQLSRQMADLQRLLADAETGYPIQIPTQDIALVVFRDGFLEAQFGARLPYYPATYRASQTSPDQFRDAEALEFRDRQPLKAASLYARLAEHRDPEVRAQALVRLARAYRLAKLPSKALEAYRSLAGMDSATVWGDPAEMLAHLGAAEIYSEQKDMGALKNEASAIATALAAGRWTLRRSSYEALSERCREWLASALPAESASGILALADAADTIFLQWKNGALKADSPNRRTTVRARNRSVLVLWSSDAGRLSLICAGPTFIESTLGPSIGASADSPSLVLEDAEGHRVLGNSDATSPVRAVRTASSTGLPWTIYALPSDPRAPAGRLSGQAAALLAALALIVLFALTASFFMARSITREIAVARLQSDFVAAVSHEFRSPLTTIMQLSELLARGRVSGDEKRVQFYQTLLGESRRLHRLVESILNFGRLESGKYRYDFQAMDLGEFARGVIEDFSKSAAELGYSVEFHSHGGPMPVRADREALGRALWNLLDNAVKYSPEHKTIQVQAAADASNATLSVSDHGLGILPHEKEAIFTRFVRGAAAGERNIRGTGIGLAMVRSTLQAHGGTIEVESVPGDGSTFTMVLPAIRDTGNDSRNSR